MLNPHLLANMCRALSTSSFRRLPSTTTILALSQSPMPTAFSDIEYRMIESFKTHFEEFSKSLVAYLANGMSVFRGWALILISAVANSATRLAVLLQTEADPHHNAPLS